MEYIAHIDEDCREREQTLKMHLEETARLCQKFAEVFGKGDWGYCCGLLHDIGKYSMEFQKKIRENSNKMVDHSTAGAQLCFELGGMYSLMSYCIAGHHGGMPDCGSSADTGNLRTLMGRSRKQIKDYQAYREEIEIPVLKSEPFDLKNTKNFDFSVSVFLRMLYSCLVDADFLNTEEFMKNGEIERDSGESMDILLSRLENHISDWLQNPALDTVNGRRTEILKSCMESGKKEKGIFRLTVPTGGGKTISSLAFALRHAVEHHMDRVIYVIPYTSIIEQNAEIFREILGPLNVLEHHCGMDYEEAEAEELKLMQLATENWDKPVIVTTNVQFFESLFSNRSSGCRKLHSIVNSVIIFDEAQMLPNDYLVPCTAIMEELVRQYKASIVLCTATQPALTSFFQTEKDIVELCPRVQEQFRFFERTTFQNIGTVSEGDLTEKLMEESQVLCIVNTKKRAQSLYKRLCEQSVEGGVYHLSTSMYPKHRRSVLKKLKERLADGQKCILISTSLVEAGVNLDFQSVYRELAGLDSMIQAAGRCNREGKRKTEESKVSIFRFEDQERVPGQRQQIDVTKALLAENAELSSLKSIERYFKMLYHFRGESLDKKHIMDEFQGRRYNFSKVGEKFHLIEENAKTVFVKKEDEAIQLLEEMRQKGYSKSRMRKASQFCISVYDRDVDVLLGTGKIRPVSEEMRDFFELNDQGIYSEEIGMDLSIESGGALFL